MVPLTPALRVLWQRHDISDEAGAVPGLTRELFPDTEAGQLSSSSVSRNVGRVWSQPGTFSALSAETIRFSS